jgi:hypothetical protein
LESVPHEFEALAVLLVLLPGFLCARIVQALCVRPKQSDVDKILESLLYSFIVYLCFAVVSGGAIPVKVDVTETEDVKTYSVEIQRSPLATLAGISVCLGLLIGAVNTKDLSGRFFRWARLSQRTTRSSVWNDVFHERSGTVLVGLADGRRVMGWAEHYSDDPKEGSLFLQKAAWIKDDGAEAPINGAGILITKESKVEYIEFLEWKIPPENFGPNQPLPTLHSQTPAQSPSRASTG